MKIKVGQVTPAYFPQMGGKASHVQALSEHLVLKDYDVAVLATDASGKLAKEELVKGVQILRFRSRTPGNSYSFSCEIKRYL